MSAENFKYNCVLLIDDDATDLYINKRILEISRFAKNIIVKKSCVDALNYLRDETTSPETTPDVIFLDYFMPIQGGKEFLDRFEKLPESIISNTKVIMLSVLDEELRPNNYSKSRIFASIAKPLTEEKLERAFNPATVSSI